jgi:hypothetical protein
MVSRPGPPSVLAKKPALSESEGSTPAACLCAGQRLPATAGLESTATRADGLSIRRPLLTTQAFSVRPQLGQESLHLLDYSLAYHWSDRLIDQDADKP